MFEQRSSVHGRNDDDNSNDEYVNKSEYELDFDLDDINRMKEYQAGNEESREDFMSPEIQRVKSQFPGHLNTFEPTNKRSSRDDLGLAFNQSKLSDFHASMSLQRQDFQSQQFSEATKQLGRGDLK